MKQRTDEQIIADVRKKTDRMQMEGYSLMSSIADCVGGLGCLSTKNITYCKVLLGETLKISKLPEARPAGRVTLEKNGVTVFLLNAQREDTKRLQRTDPSMPVLPYNFLTSCPYLVVATKENSAKNFGVVSAITLLGSAVPRAQVIIPSEYLGDILCRTAEAKVSYELVKA